MTHEPIPTSVDRAGGSMQRNARILRSYEARLAIIRDALAQRSDAGVAASLVTLDDILQRTMQLNLTNAPHEVAEDIRALGRAITITEGQL